MKRIMLFGLLLVASSAWARPPAATQTRDDGPLVRYGAKPPGSGSRAVTAIVAIEPVMRDCGQEVAPLLIERLEFEGASSRIVSFRGVDGAGQRMVVSIAADVHARLPNADRDALSQLLREGNRVVVTLLRCGSGGYLSARDIYSAEKKLSAPPAR